MVEKCNIEHIKLPLILRPKKTKTSERREFDFSQLSSSVQQDLRPSDREKLEAEFKPKIDALVLEIQINASKLQALDQYKTLQEKERDVIEEFKAARKEGKEVTHKYNSIKQRRCELFMDAFNHISGNIDKIYKQLTKSGTHPLGGTAYLNLSVIIHEDDPFLHGINYTDMPPTKHFLDMEQLSAGEKTVAALSLLFTIHSYKPSPFFILDEIDAALDNLNVAKLAAFIPLKSCDRDGDRGSGFQSIVISLKDSFMTTQRL